MIHSKNGNRASITTGTSGIGELPVADDDPCGQRRDQHGANHPGGGVFTELAHGIGKGEHLSRRCAPVRWSSLILQVVDDGKQCRRCRFEKLVRGLPRRRRLAGDDRVGQVAIGLRACRPRRPSRRPGRPARARRWREVCCTSTEMRWSPRRRRRGPRTSAHGAAARRDRRRPRAAAARHRAVRPAPVAARSAASSATLGPLCSRVSRMLRTTEKSSSPARMSSRGSRSSPACRRKSRTVVASP